MEGEEEQVERWMDGKRGEKRMRRREGGKRRRSVGEIRRIEGWQKGSRNEGISISLVGCKAATNQPSSSKTFASRLAD